MNTTTRRELRTGCAKAARWLRTGYTKPAQRQLSSQLSSCASTLPTHDSLRALTTHDALDQQRALSIAQQGQRRGSQAGHCAWSPPASRYQQAHPR